VARALATTRDVEIVNTEHNDHRYFTLAQNVSNTVTLPLADAVVSNSEHTRDSFRWYERRLVSPEKHQVIYNGVDFERIQEGREMEAPIDLPDGPLVCNVGVATEQKDQDTLLKAMPSVLSEVPDASLVVVGDGPLLPDLKQTARELGIIDSVVFTGYLPRREEVYSVLDRTDVFVVSSEYEGFCVALVEAMACETAVVASDIGVLREVAGDTCEFAPTGNPDEFAARIISLLHNQERANHFAELGWRRANNQFRIEETAQRCYGLYCQVSG
jgi:glycosyltransferase involved in cell wall biosynthesis